ncbi:Uncharacterised protein [Actinobacillus lignieresii]|nr:hypothetical protein [Actinobacillus lignieresii]VEB26184.1 Uncharacterised protein [Actinobacillus lignieresii]
MAGLIVCVLIVAMFGCLGFVAYLWHIEDLKRLEIERLKLSKREDGKQ